MLPAKVHVKIEETCDSPSQCDGVRLGLFLASNVPPPPPPSNTFPSPTPHLVEKAMNALLLLAQTPHVKTDETCESNDVGLCNSRCHMREAITYFEIMLPRLSAHDAQIFVARMGVMLQCCMAASQPTGDIFAQDSYTQACGALLALAPCKMEIEQEATRQHVGDHGSGQQFREAK